MSLQTYQNNINRTRKDIADIEKKISDLRKKEADNLSRIGQIKRSINKNTSVSTLNSKARQIENYQKDNANISRKIAELSKKLANKSGDLSNHLTSLNKEEIRESKKIEDAQKRREREQLAHQQKLTQELEQQRKLFQELNDSGEDLTSIMSDNKKIDLFISHASEDKDELVRPLVEELQKLGIDVWYDEFTLKIGDSLRRSIDKGLANAKYGVVVLSSSFFKKNWPQYELDGMVAREMEGTKVILPIWHKVTKSDKK